MSWPLLESPYKVHICLDNDGNPKRVHPVFEGALDSLSNGIEFVCTYHIKDISF